MLQLKQQGLQGSNTVFYSLIFGESKNGLENPCSKGAAFNSFRGTQQMFMLGKPCLTAEKEGKGPEVDLMLNVHGKMKHYNDSLQFHITSPSVNSWGIFLVMMT